MPWGPARGQCSRCALRRMIMRAPRHLDIKHVVYRGVVESSYCCQASWACMCTLAAGKESVAVIAGWVRLARDLTGAQLSSACVTLLSPTPPCAAQGSCNYVTVDLHALECAQRS